MEHPNANPAENVNVVLTVLWFGVVWGAIEAVLGGLLHLALPATIPGRVMIAVAVVLMAYSIDRTGHWWMPAAMAVVAAPLKLFSATLLTLPITAPAVVNPALAILAEGLTFSIVAYAFFRLPVNRRPRLALVGLAAGGLQIVAYGLIVRHLGVGLYPPQEVLSSLGTKYPMWATSAQGMLAYLYDNMPLAAIAGAMGGLAAGHLPEPLPRPLSSAFLWRGIATSLALYIAGMAFLG